MNFTSLINRRQRLEDYSQTMLVYTQSQISKLVGLDKHCRRISKDAGGTTSGDVLHHEDPGFLNTDATEEARSPVTNGADCS